MKYVGELLGALVFLWVGYLGYPAWYCKLLLVSGTLAVLATLVGWVFRDKTDTTEHEEL